MNFAGQNPGPFAAPEFTFHSILDVARGTEPIDAAALFYLDPDKQ
jgi:hypothetical protein